MENENQQTTSSTTKKISAALLGGSVSIIAVWAVGEFSGIDIPAEVASAFSTLCSLIASWLIPDEIEE
jgi:hypothetical protein